MSPGTWLIAGAGPLGNGLSSALESKLGDSALRRVADTVAAGAGDADNGIEEVIYLAASRSPFPGRPDPADAGASIGEALAAGVKHVVLVSSSRVVSPDNHHSGMVEENAAQPGHRINSISASWRELEERAAEVVRGRARLTVLRPTPTPLGGGEDQFSRLLRRGHWALTLPGHDPSLQFLALNDLADGIVSALERSSGGTYYLAPRSVVPLRRALRLAGARRVPFPRLARKVLRRFRRGPDRRFGGEELEFLRYFWTVSGARAERELGFRPRHSSAEVAASLGDGSALEDGADCDDFGMDPGYIEFYRRTLLRFLHDRYWRIEARGLEHIPALGGAVLVGVHRGFMPWDGVMALEEVARASGRYVRFLIHPGLVKFPFLFNFMTKLGGVPANRVNGERLLARGEVVGIFPEGIRGAFSLYRNAYRLKRFGRDEFVRMAIRRQVPLIPFATVGSAEIFPILARVDWLWWRRWTEWPCLPITPTFPIAPVPLPAKWHTRFLDPIPTAGRIPPEAAEDPEVVRRLSDEIRSRLQVAIDEMRGRRRHIFFGSIFPPAEGASSPSRGARKAES
ncbi:MAG TPA: 1-acyl-sn-glycerol-3-phosphate acyltransferase [Thermoanaerobaculia bacterium]|nr:1-acyl-sn-glycerol-3-phosphate acyltransferase [Thermoanaerobaculia bacterium]